MYVGTQILYRVKDLPTYTRSTSVAFFSSTRTLRSLRAGAHLVLSSFHLYFNQQRVEPSISRFCCTLNQVSHCSSKNMGGPNLDCTRAAASHWCNSRVAAWFECCSKAAVQLDCCSKAAAQFNHCSKAAAQFKHCGKAATLIKLCGRAVAESQCCTMLRGATALLEYCGKAAAWFQCLRQSRSPIWCWRKH